MFENLSYIALQNYWWILISILGSVLVFMMFVQGGQTLIPQIAKTDIEKRMMYNSIGRRWDLTFSMLVVFGGAFFASFPLFYATSFGGAYWVWMLILFSFIIQAVSYEYRSKKANFLGTKTYDIFLIINGVLATILIGTAVGTFFTGSLFSIDFAKLADPSSPLMLNWEGPAHGLEAALNITSLSLGLTVFFLARVLGALYFINSIDDDVLVSKTRNMLKKCTIMFLIFFLLFVTLLLTKEGFAFNPETGEVFMEDFKYLHNLLAMPVVLILFLLGVVGVLYGIFIGAFKNSTKGIWYSGVGTILTVLALFFLAGFNNTAFYPSTFDLQSSITIRNGSSSKFTLIVMSYVSLLLPFVLAYMWYAWKALTNKKIDKADIENDDMAY